ncbi:MAG: PilZ domain-containing protein [Sphingomonadaceae bacterium]|nr:PilZ domain-containing protein [Sphingomonadaceae bacterium]
MRSYNRFVIDKEIACQIKGRTLTVGLYNLSCGGCMIESASKGVRKDARIVLQINDKTEMPGKIVWRIGKNAGIKFDLPLHHAVVAAMGPTASDEDFDQYDPRDRFGIPLIG